MVMGRVHRRQGRPRRVAWVALVVGVIGALLLWRVAATDDAILQRTPVGTGRNAGPVALALDARTGRVFVATTSAPGAPS